VRAEERATTDAATATTVSATESVERSTASPAVSFSLLTTAATAAAAEPSPVQAMQRRAAVRLWRSLVRLPRRLPAVTLARMELSNVVAPHGDLYG